MSQYICRLPEVMRRTGLSRATVYQRVKEGGLTPPVALGSRAVGWPANEIESINTARIAGKADAEIRELVKKLVAARRGESKGGDHE